SCGELAAIRVHTEQGIALYDPQLHRSHAVLYSGHDPGVCAHNSTTFVLWSLGYPAQALQSNHTAVALAHELAHPLPVAFVLAFTARLHQLRREGPLAQERAEAALTLADEQGFALFVAWGTILRGWALAEQGQVEEGIAQIQQGLAASRATGA